MNIQVRLALRYLNGRKLRSFLTTLAIVFGVLLIFGVNTILPAFMSAFQANIMALASEVDVTITSKTGDVFPETVVDKVAAIEDVRIAVGSLERSLGFPADYVDGDPALADQITAVTLVGADPEKLRSIYIYQLEAGRFLTAADRAVTVIAASLAEKMGLELGDTLTLPTVTGLADLEIVGILPQRLLPGNEEVLVSLADAQSLLDMPGKINVIDANYAIVTDARRAELENEIKTTLGDTYTLGALQAGAEILNNFWVAQTIFSVIGVLGLLMGGFIILNTFRTIVAERRRDIGMLRAIGASRSTVIWLIVTEGLIQGVVGSVIGLVLGYGFAVLITQAMTPVLRQFMNVTVNSPVVSWQLVLAAVGMGIGVTLLAGLLPARAAGRMTPLEALRPPVGEVSLRKLAGWGLWVGLGLIAAGLAALLTSNTSFIALGAVLFIIGLIMVAPALVTPLARLFGMLLALLFARNGVGQLAEGNLARQPGRAVVTASTTMIALTILLMAASMISSIFLTFDQMLRNSLGSDFLLVPPSVSLWGMNVGAKPELADELRAIEGVEVVSSLRFAASKAGETAVGVLGIEPANYTETSGLTFVKGDSQTAFAALESGRGLIANAMFATNAGVEPGDEVSLLTANGEVTYEVVGIANDYLNAKTVTAYLSQANLAADFGRSEDVFYQINTIAGADKPAVEAAIKEVMAPYPQFRVIDGEAYYNQNAGIFQAAFGGLFALMLFLAIPSLIAMVNTLAIGVIERTREIGMLRAVGATRNQVRNIVVAEAILLAALGTAFGLMSGLYLGYLGVRAIAAIGFAFDYIFPASGVIAGVAIGLFFGVLAAIVPARQAARLEIVQALQYE